MKVTRISFQDASRITAENSVFLSRPARFLLGAAILVGFGTLVVKANDGVQVRGILLQFSKPVRQAVQTRVVAPIAQIPAQIRRYVSPQSASMPRGFAIAPASQSSAATAPRFFPSLNDRAPPSFAPVLEAPVAAPKPAKPAARRVPNYAAGWTSGAGISTPTNYCVRLCDGFAFPVGWAGLGQEQSQEAACQIACPGADTALYTAPAGAKDLDSATRQGRPYTALPTAFLYRDKRQDGCTCNAPGASQSSTAVLTDFTLRRGDLVMTRIGMRHFDGAQQIPYRATNFADASARIKDPAQLKKIRAMEVASVRGILPEVVPNVVRSRIANEAKRIEQDASAKRIAEAKSGSTRFQPVAKRVELPVVLPRSSTKQSGFAALN